MQLGAKWWSRRTLAQRFVALTAALIAGGAIVEAAVLAGAAAHLADAGAGERAERRLDKAAEHLAGRVSELRRLTFLLSGAAPIERIAHLWTAGTPRPGESLDGSLQHLRTIFLSVIHANSGLLQVRLIGAADGGRELVRVERVGDGVRVVEGPDLRRMGDRSYFQETIRLGPGGIHLSPVDVDEQGGAAGGAHRPSLHAATPVFSRSGSPFGIIVADAAVDAWLFEISRLSGASQKFMAANHSGDYVFRSDGGRAFGSDTRPAPRLQNDWPKLEAVFDRTGASALSNREDGHLISARRVAYNPADPKGFVVLAADTDLRGALGGAWTLALLGAAIALAMAGIGVLAANSVSRPLRGLSRAAREIAEGRPAAAAATGSHAGEIGETLRIMQEAVDTRDASHRKKAERIKSEFVSTVTHELRTPLTSIMGSLGLLRTGTFGPLSGNAQRMIKLAHDNGARLVKMIDDILDIDKIEGGRLEFEHGTENLRSLLEHAARQNAAVAAQQGATIRVDAIEGDPVIETDRDRFLQVMDHLISNAAKFSPKGGTVTIAAKAKGEAVRISVADQGPGIPAAFRAHIFEKFAQADSSDKREKGGTGLGLSIAKALLERLGGKIGFETETGAGATFYFDLPWRRSAPGGGSASLEEPAAPPPRKLSV
jgi:signal transduction histidine kinase